MRDLTANEAQLAEQLSLPDDLEMGATFSGLNEDMFKAFAFAINSKREHHPIYTPIFLREICDLFSDMDIENFLFRSGESETFLYELDSDFREIYITACILCYELELDLIQLTFLQPGAEEPSFYFTTPEGVSEAFLDSETFSQTRINLLVSYLDGELIVNPILPKIVNLHYSERRSGTVIGLRAMAYEISPPEGIPVDITIGFDLRTGNPPIFNGVLE